MQQKNKYDMPFCALTKKLKPTGNKSPKFEYSADCDKVKYTCSLTKRKYTLSQISEWFLTPEVQKYHKAGYKLKEMAKREDITNPHQYDKGTDQLVYSGEDSSTAYLGNTELWNGTNWTETTDLNTARYNVGRAGNTSNALPSGGFDGTATNVTEESTGAGAPIGAWSTGGDLNTAREKIASASAAPST